MTGRRAVAEKQFGVYLTKPTTNVCRGNVIFQEDWKTAIKSLTIDIPVVITTLDGQKKFTVSINGNIHTLGDLMSVTYEGFRFTWRLLAHDEKQKLSLPFADSG